MRRSRLAFLVFGLALSTAAVAGAQSISAGNLPPNPNFGFDPTPVMVTAIDLSSPATGSGTMTSATFMWSSAPCAATVKIKFFRPSGNTLLFVDERGPFDTTGTTVTVALSPGVPVQAGDLVGVARVANCGSPVGQSPGAAAGLVAFGADIMTSVSLSSGTMAPNATLAVMASGTGSGPSPNPAAIIPVGISGPGQNGARFRVAVQLYNPTGATITGRFIFHPQGVSGSAADPSLAFAIDAGDTQNFGDLLASMGQTGIGSIDIAVTSGVAPPVASVRVFNDQGAAGTTGFTEGSFKPSEALGAGARGVLVGPSNIAAFRFNVGVRTLSSGAAIAITVRDSNGTILRTFSKTYPANFFEQLDVASFLGGFPLAANQSVTIDVVSGNAFVYGATADNITNDPAVLFARNIL